MRVEAQTAGINWETILYEELGLFLASDKRREMITGERYYAGKHDVLERRKTIVGPGGTVEECKHLQNSRVVDNQYARVVDQKVSYLLGRPLTIGSEQTEFLPALNALMGADFMRKLRIVAEDTLNCGIGWLHPYYDKRGVLRFRRIAPWEIIPFWADDAHTELERALRVYKRPRGGYGEADTMVELFTPEGLHHFVREEGELKLVGSVKPYFTCKQGGMERAGVWSAIPLIPFRAGFREIPLIRRVKSLQDGINLMLSDFQDRMSEDAHRTVLVIRNFDGEDLGEFRRNLATFGAVKVRSEGGDGGGVDTLNVEVSASNFAAILNLLKKALIENAKGFDVRDLSLSGSPNQMAIRSMYADMDLDAGMMETEFQAALRELFCFMAEHLARMGQPGLNTEKIDVIFNRDALINESESIENCLKSQEILSRESILYQHPWTSDIEKEKKRLAEEKEEKSVRGRSVKGDKLKV